MTTQPRYILIDTLPEHALPISGPRQTTNEFNQPLTITWYSVADDRNYYVRYETEIDTSIGPITDIRFFQIEGLQPIDHQ